MKLRKWDHGRMNDVNEKKGGRTKLSNKKGINWTLWRRGKQNTIDLMGDKM